jgi:hypothetical protein
LHVFIDIQSFKISLYPLLSFFTMEVLLSTAAVNVIVPLALAHDLSRDALLDALAAAIKDPASEHVAKCMRQIKMAVLLAKSEKEPTCKGHAEILNLEQEVNMLKDMHIRDPTNEVTKVKKMEVDALFKLHCQNNARRHRGRQLCGITNGDIIARIKHCQSNFGAGPRTVTTVSLVGLDCNMHKSASALASHCPMPTDLWASSSYPPVAPEAAAPEAAAPEAAAHEAVRETSSIETPLTGASAPVNLLEQLPEMTANTMKSVMKRLTTSTKAGSLKNVDDIVREVVAAVNTKEEKKEKIGSVIKMPLACLYIVIFGPA